jgi:hypothetical protein
MKKPVRTSKFPFMFYLNQTEKEALEALSASSGMSRAAYVRALIILAKERNTIIQTTSSTVVTGVDGDGTKVDVKV